MVVGCTTGTLGVHAALLECHGLVQSPPTLPKLLYLSSPISSAVHSVPVVVCLWACAMRVRPCAGQADVNVDKVRVAELRRRQAACYTRSSLSHYLFQTRRNWAGDKTRHVFVREQRLWVSCLFWSLVLRGSLIDTVSQSRTLRVPSHSRAADLLILVLLTYRIDLYIVITSQFTYHHR